MCADVCLSAASDWMATGCMWRYGQRTRLKVSPPPPRRRGFLALAASRSVQEASRRPAYKRRISGSYHLASRSAEQCLVVCRSGRSLKNKNAHGRTCPSSADGVAAGRPLGSRVKSAQNRVYGLAAQLARDRAEHARLQAAAGLRLAPPRRRWERPRPSSDASTRKPFRTRPRRQPPPCSALWQPTGGWGSFSRPSGSIRPSPGPPPAAHRRAPGRPPRRPPPSPLGRPHAR